MDSSIVLIIISLTCLHICTGPDHYLPFIALSKSRNWGVGKTILWTTLCGIGHIAGSIIISGIVMALGWGFSKISWLDSLRGNMAGWALVLLGVAYMVWCFWQMKLNKAHKHFETSDKGELYVFEHKHGQAIAPQQKHQVTPWVMFVIFALAPNEPMIPLLSVLGIGSDVWAVVGFVTVYVFATIAAMLLMVLLGFYGLSLFTSYWVEKYMQPISGIVLCLCGLIMLLFK
jgi:hypothetical protein